MISNHSKLSIIEDIGNVLPSDRMVDRARLGVFCDHNCSPDELSFRSLVQIPSTTTTYNGKPFPTSLPISHLYHPPCFRSPLYTFHPLVTLGARQLSLRDFKPQRFSIQRSSEKFIARNNHYLRGSRGGARVATFSLQDC